MKIKRSAWHYKISNWGRVRERPNDNLCNYFWALIFKCLLVFALIVYAGFVAHTFYTRPEVGVVVLFLISCLAFPAIAIHLLRNKLGKPPEMPYGNIVVEYTKAKLKGICPLIEYTD